MVEFIIAVAILLIMKDLTTALEAQIDMIYVIDEFNVRITFYSPLGLIII